MYIIYEMYALKTYLKSWFQIAINSIICFYNGKKNTYYWEILLITQLIPKTFQRLQTERPLPADFKTQEAAEKLLSWEVSPCYVIPGWRCSL